MGAIRRSLMNAKGNKELPNYLCFTALEDGTFTLRIGSNITTTMISYIDYSLDGNTWIHTSNVNNTEITITTPIVEIGKKVYWKGFGNRFANTFNINNVDDYSTFSSTGKFNATGNFKSLLYDTDFSEDSTSKDQYEATFLFYDSKIVECDVDFAKNTHNNAYANTFKNCSELINCNAKFSGIAAVNTFFCTFSSCIKLKTAPNFFGITKIVANSAFTGTFENCASIEEVNFSTLIGANNNSNLLATFKDCVSLTKVNLRNMLYSIGFDGSANQSKATFTGCTSLSRLILPKIIKFNSIYTATDSALSAIRMIDIGENITTFGGNGPRFTTNVIYVIRAVTPPSITSLTTIASGCKIFVPLAAVNDYRAASVWITAASTIYAIGGQEWIAEFGNSNEYANLTQEEREVNYPESLNN